MGLKRLVSSFRIFPSLTEKTLFSARKANLINPTGQGTWRTGNGATRLKSGAGWAGGTYIGRQEGWLGIRSGTVILPTKF